MSSITVHTAPAVLPVSQPPIAEGAVAVADGTIAAVGSAASVAEEYRGAEVVAWEGVIVPGLVNAHTHLQYTSFGAVGAVAHPTWVDWSERFVVEYEARRGEDWAATARMGVEAGLATGTTCFADIVTDLPALGALGQAGVAGVSYYELIGVDAPEWEAAVGDRVAAILAAAPRAGPVAVGLSPHAPYSLDEPVLKAAAELARRLGVRMHVHLAESDTEDSYYRNGAGALAERVAARVGRSWSLLDRGGAGMGAADFAHSCGLLGPDSHVAHGVYLGREGRALLRDTGTYVALCPRSNLTVGIDPPPVAAFLAEDALIAVGTDSLGSNTSLDLMEDVRLLRRLAEDGGYNRPDLDRRLLQAATLGGARAIGLEQMVGSLEPGKRADLAVFDVDPDVVTVERSLVEHGAGHCTATLVEGDLH